MASDPLPIELDFDKDREATPDRMNRAMSYLLALCRSVLALKPSYDDAVNRMNALSLERIEGLLAPIYDRAIFIRDQLEAALGAIGSAFTQTVTAPSFSAKTTNSGIVGLIGGVGAASGTLAFYTPTGTGLAHVGGATALTPLTFTSDSGQGFAFVGGPLASPLITADAASDGSASLRVGSADHTGTLTFEDALGAVQGSIGNLAGGGPIAYVSVAGTGHAFSGGGVAVETLTIGGVPARSSAAQDADRWFHNHG